MRLRVVPTAAFLMVLVTLLQAQNQDHDLSLILDRARERVDHFYSELQRVAWTDTVRQQELKDDRTPKGRTRDVSYDMLVRLESPRAEDHNAPFYVRDISKLIRVDGRPATAKDSSKSTNTNPAILSALHPLLVRGDRAESFHFIYEGRSDLNGRQLHLIRFNRDDVLHYSGRIWIDPETFDVLQLDWKARLPDKIPGFVRDYEVMARFRQISFENPRQTFVVFDTMNIVSIRDGNLFHEIHSFDNYKRFTGDVTIVPVTDPKP